MYPYTLPGGLKCELREMTGADEDFALSLLRRAPNSAGWIFQLLQRCVTRLGDSAQPSLDDIMSLLDGDISFLLVRLRQLSYGDEVSVELRCRSCGKTDSTVISLEDLPVTPYPEEREHSCVLPRCGRTARFRPLDGKMADRAQKLAENAPDLESIKLMLRLLDIDGEPASKQTLREMAGADRDALRTAMAAIEGGIDTAVTATCPRCGGTMKGSALGSADFFRPMGVG